MNVNLEVFDREVLENIITCLNFKMDKVIFFGQYDTMTQSAKETTEAALIKFCNLKKEDIEFIEVSTKDIDRVLEKITETVQKLEKAGGKCYFDLTGGADMVLVAMGMYSATHNIPMHRFDIPDRELKILNADADHVDKCVESQQIPLTIKQLVQLRGGVVDESLKKKFKDDLNDADACRDVEDLWAVASVNMGKWNDFSAVLKTAKTTKIVQAEEDIQEWVERRRVRNSAPNQDDIGTEANFIRYLENLEIAGVIEELSQERDWISFKYRNSRVRSCMLDSGSLLELHTFFSRRESGQYDECQIGTHLKWGLNAADEGYIVHNEIDVLLRQGHVLTFISCKSGNPDQTALYELDTVASRFGGKYARRELVTAGYVEFHHEQRAEEMGISIELV